MHQSGVIGIRAQITPHLELNVRKSSENYIACFWSLVFKQAKLQT